MNSIYKKELHELFDEIRQGNNNFENLYNKYYRLVYKIAFSILKNKENSEDIAQNVFTKIYKLDKEKLPTKSEAAWLYSVTKNECIMYLRNNKESFDIDNLYNICDENDEISKIIDNDKYDRIINKLNKQEQEIVSLKIISQMSFKDIDRKSTR